MDPVWSNLPGDVLAYDSAVQVSDSALLDRASAFRTRPVFRAAVVKARALMSSDALSGENLTLAEALDLVGRPKFSPVDVYLGEMAYWLDTALEAPIGICERLVWFWSNHFAVSVKKGGPMSVLAGLYQREAIRPYILSSFSEMVDAVCTHPAMLFYLDGWRSAGPNSVVGRRSAVGLNENFAREILELHTLGVGGGYSQEDVIELAKILTGWRFRPFDSARLGDFHFSHRHHEPGPKDLLGKRYEQGGRIEGLAALGDLARHPSTSHFLSRKMLVHFLGEAPPSHLVEELAHTFSDAGDLRAVVEKILEFSAVGDPVTPMLRNPQEFVVAMLRATGVRMDVRVVRRLLNVLGQTLWGPLGPDGFPDSTGHWLSPEGMKRRLDVAMTVAANVDATLEPEEVLELTVGDIASEDTRLAVMRAESRQQAFALLFMSPEFQWR